MFENWPEKDFFHDNFPHYTQIIDYGLKILIFSGDDDGVCPTYGTQHWIFKLPLEVQNKWKQWNHNDQVGGYMTKFNKNFTFITIRGAGHMVPAYTPSKGQQILLNYLNGNWFHIEKEYTILTIPIEMRWLGVLRYEFGILNRQLLDDEVTSIDLEFISHAMRYILSYKMELSNIYKNVKLWEIETKLLQIEEFIPNESTTNEKTHLDKEKYEKEEEEEVDKVPGNILEEEEVIVMDPIVDANIDCLITISIQIPSIYDIDIIKLQIYEDILTEKVSNQIRNILRITLSAQTHQYPKRLIHRFMKIQELDIDPEYEVNILIEEQKPILITGKESEKTDNYYNGIWISHHNIHYVDDDIEVIETSSNEGTQYDVTDLSIGILSFLFTSMIFSLLLCYGKEMKSVILYGNYDGYEYMNQTISKSMSNDESITGDTSRNTSMNNGLYNENENGRGRRRSPSVTVNDIEDEDIEIVELQPWNSSVLGTFSLEEKQHK